jgi:glycosyltransferase involved in cell wall biosynthesis
MARLPHAVLIDRRLSDQEFADLTAASDVSLLPYSNVTTSGALMASWTLGTGVIASDLPFFRELIPTPGPAGRLFHVGDAGNLAETIRAYLSIPRAERCEAAGREARKYNWPDCVMPVVRWMKQEYRNPVRGGEEPAMINGPKG